MSDKSTKISHPETPVRVADTLLPADANVVKDALGQHGIDAQVQGQMSTLADIPRPAASVWVRAEDAEAASAFLAKIEPVADDLTLCSHCGETTSATDGDCPSCGKPLGTGPMAPANQAAPVITGGLLWFLLITSNLVWMTLWLLRSGGGR